MPFILRGANILGVNSVATPRDLRLQVWARLASDLKPKHLQQIADNVVPLSDIAGAFDDYIKGAVRGRTLVDLRG
jgi:NADPH2:quinone reductase